MKQKKNTLLKQQVNFKSPKISMLTKGKFEDHKQEFIKGNNLQRKY